MYVALIPARGGSKRVRNKNLKPLLGMPLIRYSFEAAVKSRYISEVFVSTDSSDIADFARENGIGVLMRPEELSRDETPMLPVMQHALHSILPRVDVKGLVLLQPTSPLRTQRHIDDCIALFEKQDADSVVSVMKLPEHFHPRKYLRADSEGILHPRFPEIGKEEEFLVRNGPAVVVSKASVILNGDIYGKLSFPYLMSEEDSVDINTPFDFALAEAMLGVLRGS